MDDNELIRRLDVLKLILIDGGEGCSCLSDCEWRDTDKSCGDCLYTNANKIPAVDAVEVVRCRDCKHFFDNGTDNVAIYECDLLHERMRDDFFCADGERRSEDG